MSGCQFYKIGMSKKPRFIKNISAKMARLCPCFMRKNTPKINIIFKPNTYAIILKIL